MLRQRVYGLVQGWEDLNNHAQRRRDIAYQSAVGRDDDLASAPTLCRLEKLSTRAAAINFRKNWYSTSMPPTARCTAGRRIVSSMATQPVLAKAGNSYCYLPLYVFCGEQMLAAYLRPSKIDGAKHAAGILKLLVTRLRQVWPAVRIIFRCRRGEAENRIKEAQLGLFATRTSCQYFNANQFRILLSALAYTMVERLRALALKDTPLASAQINTLRNQLLKLAAVITRNTRRIRLYFASHWPSASTFQTALHALNSG